MIGNTIGGLSPFLGFIEQCSACFYLFTADNPLEFSSTRIPPILIECLTYTTTNKPSLLWQE